MRGETLGGSVGGDSVSSAEGWVWVGSRGGEAVRGVVMAMARVWSTNEGGYRAETGSALNQIASSFRVRVNGWGVIMDRVGVVVVEDVERV